MQSQWLNRDRLPTPSSIWFHHGLGDTTAGKVGGGEGLSWREGLPEIEKYMQHISRLQGSYQSYVESRYQVPKSFHASGSSSMSVCACLDSCCLIERCACLLNGDPMCHRQRVLKFGAATWVPIMKLGPSSKGHQVHY